MNYTAYLLKIKALSIGEMSIDWILYEKKFVKPPTKTGRMPTAHKFVVCNDSILIAPTDTPERDNILFHYDILFLAQITRIIEREQDPNGSGVIDVFGNICHWSSRGGLPSTPNELRPKIMKVLGLTEPSY